MSLLAVDFFWRIPIYEGTCKIFNVFKSQVYTLNREGISFLAYFYLCRIYTPMLWKHKPSTTKMLSLSKPVLINRSLLVCWQFRFLRLSLVSWSGHKAGDTWFLCSEQNFSPGAGWFVHPVVVRKPVVENSRTPLLTAPQIFRVALQPPSNTRTVWHPGTLHLCLDQRFENSILIKSL